MPYNPAFDSLSSLMPSASSPARHAQAIIPSDTVDLPTYAKAIKCNAAGHVMILPVAAYQSGVLTPVKFTVTAGEYIPVQVARVFATGTTATDLVALYA